MEYLAKDISNNTDIQKIIETLNQAENKEDILKKIEDVLSVSNNSNKLEEANIYIGDFKDDIIDKNTLINEIIRISSEEKENEA